MQTTLPNGMRAELLVLIERLFGYLHSMLGMGWARFIG